MNKFENYVVNIINEEIKENSELTFDILYSDLEFIFNIETSQECNNLFNEYKFDIMEYYFDNIEIMKETNNINQVVTYCITKIIDNNFYSEDEFSKIKQI